MVKRATIADLARQAGVSVATVDRVLNRRLPVSEDTALRVVAAAETIGYHAVGLLKSRVVETPRRNLAFLLQKRDDAFYQAFGFELLKAAGATTAVQAKCHLDYVDDISPGVVAARLREASKRADAVAIVAVDHPDIHEAVQDIAAQGKRVITLLSDVLASGRHAYLAADTRKAGRTAAWAISRLAAGAGDIGILVGSHRYLSQDMAEMSFRSYMRESAPQFRLLEPIVNLDDGRIAYDAVRGLIEKSTDLVGIYVAGGGQNGMIAALREAKAERHIVGVCNELTAISRAALLDGTIDMVLATPIATIAAKCITLMVDAGARGESQAFGQMLFPADIFISENI